VDRFKKFVKRNVYVFFSFVIFTTSLLFTGIVLLVFSVAPSVKETSVGHIYIGNIKSSSYETVLNNEINTWKRNTVYLFKYQDYVFELDTDIFVFDSEQTVQNIKENQKNVAYFSIEETQKQLIYNEMEKVFTTSIMESINFEELILQVREDLGKLIHVKTYQLFHHFLDSSSYVVLSEVIIQNVELSDVTQIVENIDDFLIKKKSRFSLLRLLQDTNLNNDQLSIVASGLLKLAHKTSLTGFVFQQNNQLPNWAEQGMNVRILRVNQYDLTFFNHQEYDYQVLIEQVDSNSIKMSLLGYPSIHSYDFSSIIKTSIPFEIIYIEDDSIDVNTPNVEIIDREDSIIYRSLVQEGREGSVIFYLRTTLFLNKEPETIKIFDEQYKALPRVYHEHTIMKEVD
jgi:phosphoglycolate phosphatase-like HAD superfamily hydrolase